MKYKHLAMLMGVMITATSVGSTATASTTVDDWSSYEVERPESL